MPEFDSSSTGTSHVEPFRLEIPQSQLDDLRGRLDRTRWPDRVLR